MDKIAAFLIEKETITGKEFMKIFHEARGVTESDSKHRISEKNPGEGQENAPEELPGETQPVSENPA